MVGRRAEIENPGSENLGHPQRIDVRGLYPSFGRFAAEETGR
jgi:hypothetical protein